MKSIFTSAFLLFTLITNAQRVEWLRNTQTVPGGPGFASTSLIATDHKSNCYTLNDYGVGAITANDTIGGIAGGSDLMIVKTDSNGNHIWTKAIGSTISDAATDICVDAEGNVIISCYLQGGFTITDDTSYTASLAYQVIKINSNGHFVHSYSTGDVTYITANGTDVYFTNNAGVTKLDSAFNVIWFKSFSPLQTSFVSNRNAISSHGNYLALSIFEGFSSSTLTAIDTVTLPWTGAGFDQFGIILMDISGSALWARASDGSPSGNGTTEYAQSIQVDVSGNVYVGAHSSEDFIHGNDTIKVLGAFGVAGVLKYDVNGNAIWAKPISFSGNGNTQYMCGDGTGNIIVVGSYDGSVTIGTNSGPSVSSGGYIASFNSQGNANWTKFHSSAPADGPLLGVAQNSSGDFWVSGKPSSNTSWDCLNLPSGMPMITYWGRFTMNPPQDADAAFTFSSNIFDYTFTPSSNYIDSLSWDFGDGATSNQNNPTHTFAGGSDDTITLVVYYGTCTDTFSVQIFDVGFPENKIENKISLYPMPADNYLIIKSTAMQKNNKIKLTDITGRIVFETEMNTDEIKIETSLLSNGSYLLLINDSESKLIKQVIVQH